MTKDNLFFAKVRTLRWNEPIEVRERFYPAKRSNRLSWPILGGLIFLAAVVLVIFVDNPDPNAKWAVLAIAAISAGGIGFIAPWLFALSNRCTIAEFGIQRSSGVPRFELALIRFQVLAWDWYDIGHLELHKSIVGQAERWLLSVHDRNGGLLGCLGLESEGQIPAIQAWADYKNCPLVISESNGAESSELIREGAS